MPKRFGSLRRHSSPTRSTTIIRYGRKTASGCTLFTVWCRLDIWRVNPAGGSPEPLTDLNAPVNFLAPLDAHTLLFGRARKTNRDPGCGRWTSSERWRAGSARGSSDTRRCPPVRMAVAWSLLSLTRFPGYPVCRCSTASWRNERRSSFRCLHHGLSLHALVARPCSIYPPAVWATGSGGTRTGSLWKSGEASKARCRKWRLYLDGNQVAVVVSRKGKRRLVVMLADGTNVRTLTDAIDIQGAAGLGPADWSPDGAWIL